VEHLYLIQRKYKNINPRIRYRQIMKSYEIQYSNEYQRMLDNFLDFELESNLFSLCIEDIPIWERVRHLLFRDLLRNKGLVKKHTRKAEQDYVNYLKGGYKWVRSLFIKNPYLAASSDYLFIGNPRRKPRKDGQQWDYICDFIIDELSIDNTYIEPPFQLSHRKPAKTENIRYLDLITYTSFALRELNFVNIEITDEEKQKIDNVENDFKSEFDVRLDFESRITEKLRERESRKWLYEHLLDKIDPKISIIVASAFKHTYIEVCKEHNIPVIELQHGGFGPDHLGYSYPGERSSTTFPDYLFVFGEFWKNMVEFPIEEESVFPVGYPYLEKEKSEFNTDRNGEGVLFISQPPSGKITSKFAANFSQRNEDRTIVYKLHPKEYNNWADQYPWLKDSPITIIAEDEPPLYQLLSESKIQIGVNSTVLWEGLMFNLDTYVLRAPGYERLSYLIESDIASLVSSVSELEEMIDKPNHNAKFDKEYLFTSDPIRNISNALNNIQNKNTK
jgi:hypothetical protein